MLLTEITSSNVEWVLPHGKDLTDDFTEYYKKEGTKWESRAAKIGMKFPMFESAADLRKQMEAGRIFKLSEKDWTTITNLSYNSDLDDLRDLVSGYMKPRDVDRIVKGFEDGVEMPLPIVVKGSKGRWIMAGNTRLNVARIMGIPQYAVEVDISE